jgi:hypothetical protein
MMKLAPVARSPTSSGRESMQKPTLEVEVEKKTFGQYSISEKPEQRRGL